MDRESVDDNADRVLHELLSGLSTSHEPLTSGLPSWGAEGTTHSSRSPHVSSNTRIIRSTLSSPSRTSLQAQLPTMRRSGSTGPEHGIVENDVSLTPTHFEPPLRSIFASGQPTSSVSANTARASMSTTITGSMSRPLAALTSPPSTRRPARSTDFSDQPALLGQVDCTIPGTHKDVDDPTSNYLGVEDTSHTLSGLFTASDGLTSGSLSRHNTYGRSHSGIYKMVNDTSTLGGHLLHAGFMEGKHSDITVHAFGQQYKLHKLLLERIPFFSAAFSPSWAESSAREMTLTPDIDSNITRRAFELTLKRVYGTVVPHEEEQEAIGLFATASWLDMPELVDTCVEHILRQMQPSELHTFIRLVTTSYYGKAGERILSSAKAMLCRSGWEMAYEYWDNIPAGIIREVIGGDPFYVPGEWERWFLTVKLLNRRLRRLAVTNNLVSPEGRYLKPRPKSLRQQAYRVTNIHTTRPIDSQDRIDDWFGLYSHPDIRPLLELLDTGIHYVHLRFEQLQHMRLQRDILGAPVLPERVIQDALWMGMELRQRVLNAREGDLELGLSEIAEDIDATSEASEETDTVPISKKGKYKEDPELTESQEDIVCDDRTQSRKYWIPSIDVSCVMGGCNALPEWKSRSQRLSAPFEASDMSGLTDSFFDNYTSPIRHLMSQSTPRFSRYPPFRFCAEFPNPRSLKERKKIYSQTVWYAGSNFNLYIQRINTSKSQQLGIYLHRTKDREVSEDSLLLTVDDRIGQLEREMLLRKNEPRAQNRQDETLADTAESSEHVLPSEHATPRRHTRHSINHSDESRLSRVSISSESQMPMPDDGSDYDMRLLSSAAQPSVPTLAPYTDPRSTIKTYFKIYSPSKAGRLLCAYESAPDNFNFGKSWGWKSSQMVLDDSIGDEVMGGNLKSGGLNGGASKDGKLRYMVTVGIV